MEVRGQRECQSCGTRWSYYETGQITCPSCGSVRSVGLDDPTQHTDSPATLDLTPVQADIDDDDLRTSADRAADLASEYVRQVGFVHAGEFQPLDETFLAASELRRVATALGRAMQVTDQEERYFLTLLRGTDQGERPEPSAVPESLAPERGLAIAASIDGYLSDFRRVYDERERELDRVLASVTTHRKRIEALDGDVDPAEAEQLVRTVRDLYRAAQADDETALARALERL